MHDAVSMTAAVVMIGCALGINSLNVKIKFVERYQLDRVLGLLLMVAAGVVLAGTPLVIGLFEDVMGLVEVVLAGLVGVVLACLRSLLGQADLQVGQADQALKDSVAHGIVICVASLVLLRIIAAAVPKVSDRKLQWRDVHVAVAVPLLMTVCLGALGDALQEPVSWVHDEIGGWFEQQVQEVQ